MNEREWIRTAPLRDVFYAGILRGLDGYPDDDTERPIEVLRTLANTFKEGGWTHTETVETWDGVSVKELREWAQQRLGEIQA